MEANEETNAESTQSDANQYKFMTNILEESKHKTRYVKLLKNITIDAQVSFERLFIAIGLAVIVTVVLIWTLTNLGGRFSYMGLPLMLISLAILVLLVVYIISSRRKSMLTSVMDMLLFQIGERTRKIASPKKTVRTVGISDVEDGMIRFRNGDVGFMYRVEGNMSRSVLPAIANATARVRHQYFISRPETTQEQLITSVQRADVRAKKRYLRDAYFKAKNSNDPDRAWRMQYCTMQYNLIKDNMEKNDTQLFQVLLIRDKDEKGLDKAIRAFEAAASNGMLASAQLITSTSEIARRLRGLTVLSHDGLGQITGQNESVQFSVDENDVRQSDDPESSDSIEAEQEKTISESE